MGDIHKRKAKWEYWHKLPVTNQKFFKVMLGDFENHLRIPSKFSKNFRETLMRWCTLRGESGNEWKVQVKREDGDILFSSGWENFVRDHGIEAYDLLVFRYAGSSSFRVSIFSKSGCEREGSYFTTVSSSKSSYTSILHQEEDDKAVMREGASSFAFGKTQINNGEHSAAFLSGKRKTRAQRSHYNAVYKGKWKVDGHLPKFEIFDHDNDDDNDDNDDDEEEEEEDDDDYGHSYREEEEEPEESFSCNVHILKPRKQVQKCYISARRQVTGKEKKKACERAQDHIDGHKSSGVPMVGITMLRTHVYKGLYLTIPKEWAMENMIRKNHDVELQVPGAKDYWLVGCRWIHSAQCQLRPKWADFVLDNNLEEGDVCVFELVERGSIRSKERPLFNVWIFRVVADLVPLTPKRMA